MILLKAAKLNKIFISFNLRYLCTQKSKGYAK